MPRPERPLDPATGSVAEFADRLRRLRKQAGSPSYRHIAAQTHFSDTTLSEAAAGRRMPTLDVTLAYVRACGGDPVEWQQLWQDAMSAAAPVQQSQPRRPLLPRPTITLAGGLAITVLLGLSVYAAVASSSDLRHPVSATSSSTAGTASALTFGDGADPKQSGCATGARALAVAMVADPNGTVYGTVELRYSSSCHSAWTRYTPTTTGPRPTTVTITVARPNPIGNATVTFVVQDGAIYSDMELFQGGCIQASAAVIHNSHVTATAHTACVTEPAL
jgi:hypothetical protein